MARERTAQRGGARANTRLSRRVFVQRMAALGAVTVFASCTDQVVTPSPTPTPKLRRIGYLSGLATSTAMNYAGPLRQRLHELDYVEGRDIEFVFKVADSRNDRLPALAAELVKMPVDVLIAEAQPAQLAAKAATKTIPIVITLSSDPVGAGLVASLSKPGENITGLMTQSAALTGKRVEILKESVPGLTRIGIIWNANIPNMRELVKVTEDAARTLRVATQVFDAHDPVEVDADVEIMGRGDFDGFVMLTGLSITRNPAQVPDIAAKYGLPQMFSDIEMVTAGGLMHYGSNYAAIYQKAALYVDKVLKGARAGDLPIEQASEIDFIVNLKMARRLGIEIPDHILRQATKVIPP